VPESAAWKKLLWVHPLLSRTVIIKLLFCPGRSGSSAGAEQPPDCPSREDRRLAIPKQFLKKHFRQENSSGQRFEDNESRAPKQGTAPAGHLAEQLRLLPYLARSGFLFANAFTALRSPLQWVEVPGMNANIGEAHARAAE